VKLQIFKLVAMPHDNNPADKSRYTGFAEWMIHGARGQLSLNSPDNNYAHASNTAKQIQSLHHSDDTLLPNETSSMHFISISMPSSHQALFSRSFTRKICI
jgi:hypothetical protein